MEHLRQHHLNSQWLSKMVEIRFLLVAFDLIWSFGGCYQTAFIQVSPFDTNAMWLLLHNFIRWNTFSNLIAIRVQTHKTQNSIRLSARARAHMNNTHAQSQYANKNDQEIYEYKRRGYEKSNDGHSAFREHRRSPMLGLCVCESACAPMLCMCVCVWTMSACSPIMLWV